MIGGVRHLIFLIAIPAMGAKGGWDFQISDRVKNLDGTDI